MSNFPITILMKNQLSLRKGSWSCQATCLIMVAVHVFFREHSLIFQYNFKVYSIKACTFMVRFSTDALSIIFFQWTVIFVIYNSLLLIYINVIDFICLSHNNVLNSFIISIFPLAEGIITNKRFFSEGGKQTLASIAFSCLWKHFC